MSINRIAVVGAAVRKNNKVLAARRSEKMGLPGKWEFPGGKVEKGETDQEALHRELLEELDITVEVGEYIATGYSEFNGKGIELKVYSAELVNGIPKAMEHSELRWVEISSLDTLDWAEADIPAYRELMKRGM